MPTGYTAGILDGEITTFEQFAKLCIRNFGATIHMRDDSMDAEWTPRKPTDYHTKAIKEANKLISDSEDLPDDKILKTRKAQLIKDKDYHEKQIVKDEESRKKLEWFLEKAKEYEPPSSQHKSLKDFMIEQLNSTINFDCNGTYHKDKIVEINKELATLNADQIRHDMQMRAHKDLLYHKREHAAEVSRCRESNQWVEQFFESLNIKA